MNNYNKKVELVRKYLNEIKIKEASVAERWMDIAKIAYEVCEPFYGGIRSEHSGYTYKQFADDCGCCSYVLSNKLRIYRNVYIKSEITNEGKIAPSKLSKADLDIISRVGLRSKKDDSKTVIDRRVKAEKKNPKEDSSLISYIKLLSSARFFVTTTQLEALNSEKLAELYTHAKAIVDTIDKGFDVK